MSLVTLLLLAVLALTALWLVSGMIDTGRRRSARRVPGNIDRTAAQLFQRWSDH